MIKHYPLDLGRVIYRPNRKLYLITTVLPNIPNAIAKVVEVISKHNIEIITIMGNIFMREELGHLTIIADLTESKKSINELALELQSLPEVILVQYVEPEEDSLIIDKYHFPIVYGVGRAIIFDVEVLSSMFEELKRQWGSAGEAFIFYLGYMGGKRYVKQVMEKYKELTKRQLGIMLRDMGQAYGWAIFELKEEDDKIIIKAHELFECISPQLAKKKPNSQFFRGFISGVASTLLEKDMIAEEVKCIAKGDEYCEFIIKEREK